MHCPFCNHDDTKVIDSRLAGEGKQVRRRRECVSCEERFTTFEDASLALPYVVKTDGTREPFDEEKLRRGLTKALEKRPVSAEAMEDALAKLLHDLHTAGEREVSSRFIGDLVMSALRELDQVAFVRFASVYRQFEDVAEFRREIDQLEKNHAETRPGKRDKSQLSLLPSSNPKKT